MASHWLVCADRVLAEVFASLPKDASTGEVIRAIYDAYPFGERRHYPYKVWCRRAREWRASWEQGHRPPMPSQSIARKNLIEKADRETGSLFKDSSTLPSVECAAHG